MQLMVAELIAEGLVRLVDGTLIACANYPGLGLRGFRSTRALRLEAGAGANAPLA